jgi:hypothetical protein
MALPGGVPGRLQLGQDSSILNTHHGAPPWTHRARPASPEPAVKTSVGRFSSQHQLTAPALVPPDKSSSEVAGYHCWAEYYSTERGWIPVDISQAWKHEDKRDYFFGGHDDNRMQFTVGRDLMLNPPQTGPPLNYFVYPYVEVDGKEFSNVAIHFRFAIFPKAERLPGQPECGVVRRRRPTTMV